MIDWLSVIANGFWIVGLALVLAALSYYYWHASQAGHSLREEFGGPAFQKVAAVGLLLVGVGLAGTSTAPWQVALAGATVLGSAVALVLLWRASS